MQNKRKKWVVIIVVLLVVVISLPPVWSRVIYHSKEVYRTVKYWIKPPSEAVFVPSTNHNVIAATPTLAAEPSDMHTPQITADISGIPTEITPEATFTPTPTVALTPLPSSVLLTGILCEPQLMNNCGPATLSMYLSFYDWGKDQLAAAAVLKPNAKDVNVNPYEVVDFVNGHTDLNALWRYGGDLETIQTLLNAGIPVMIEKSFEPFSLRDEGWMGHYNLVVGYDNEKQVLTVQDSYLLNYAPWGGKIPQEMWDTFIGFDFSYRELEQAWRAFNYVFIVVYPPEKEMEVLKALGPLATDEEACRVAYDRAMQETSSLTEVRDRFFAWFNAGTSSICLEDYTTAASAFDTAFGIYPEIAQDSRPYRILWYETGPYPAYYHTGRYEDVISLASQTLGHMAEPVLEESYYWRARSYNALGNQPRAIADLRTSLEYHPGYAPSIDLLNQLGVTP